MSMISTHVLDTVLGKPAANVAIHLEKKVDEQWLTLAHSHTDLDGRCGDLCPHASEGTYRLTFATGTYFLAFKRSSIYPEIPITFQIQDNQHYHLPLLLSDNSYTTYRGS